MRLSAGEVFALPAAALASAVLIGALGTGALFAAAGAADRAGNPQMMMLALPAAVLAIALVLSALCCLATRQPWLPVALLALLLWSGLALARDDGRFVGSPLKSWFDTLKSGNGLCCSDADGFAVSDPDWETRDGHYRVRLDGEWIVVPDDAVITEPNRAGRTMVWPIRGSSGIYIRCFMPGSMM